MNDNLIDSDSRASSSQPKKALPNAVGVLVCGILAIVLAAGVGFILGIISLALSGSCNSAYKANPDLYTQSSINNFKAGRTCAIIGLSLTVLVVIMVVLANAGRF